MKRTSRILSLLLALALALSLLPTAVFADMAKAGALPAVSAGAHLAAARSVITRADLDGPGLCRIDPYTGGPDYAGPVIHMNQTPGIGITAVPGL